MHDPSGDRWPYDVVLAVQVVVLAMLSGVVAWLQRWRRDNYARRHLWASLTIDVCTSALVGVSVYITARHSGWEPDLALGTGIVSGHYGARWLGVNWNEYQTMRNERQRPAGEHNQEDGP